MKIVIAQLKHETNTFSPVPTGLARFTRIGDEPPCGDAAVREYKNTGSAIAAMIDLAEQAGAEYRVPVAGNAPGRQPWTIQNLLPNIAAVSQIDAYSVQITFFLFLIILTTLLIAEIKIMLSAIKNRSAH